MEWEASTRWQRWRVNPEDANDGMEDAIPPSQPRHPERMGEAGLSTFEGEKRQEHVSMWTYTPPALAPIRRLETCFLDLFASEPFARECCAGASGRSKTESVV